MQREEVRLEGTKKRREETESETWPATPDYFNLDPLSPSRDMSLFDKPAGLFKLSTLFPIKNNRCHWR